MTFKEIVDNLPIQLKIKLLNLESLVERNDYHPEANTYEHVRIVTERCISTGDKDLIMAGIFHDIGKLDAAVRVKENNHGTDYFTDNLTTGKIKTYGHEGIGTIIASAYKSYIEDFGANYETVIYLVGEHMRIKQFSKMKKTKQDSLRKHKDFEKLLIFTDADSMLKEFTHGK